jgi:hypothetical protein
MSSSVLAPPPPSSLPPRESPPLPRKRAPLSRPIQHDPTGRITRSSVVGSVVVHAVFFALVLFAIRGEPFRVGIKPGTEAGTPAAQAPGGGGGETVSYLDVKDFAAAEAMAAPSSADAPTAAPAVVDTLAFPETAPRTPVLPRQALPAQARPNAAPSTGGGAPAPATGAPSAPAAGQGAGAPGADAAGQAGGAPNAGSGGNGGILRPGYVDPRLVVKPGPLPDPPPKSDIEIYREQLQARIDAINRGDEEEAEHQRRLHNWTWRDSKGREWGLGAGGVPIVAGHRLPTAIAPPIPRDRDKEDAEREAAHRSAEIAARACAPPGPARTPSATPTRSPRGRKAGPPCMERDLLPRPRVRGTCAVHDDNRHWGTHVGISGTR